MVEQYNLDYFDLSTADGEVLYLDEEKGRKVKDAQWNMMNVVIWQKDFSAEDFFVWYYFSTTEYKSRVPGILRLHLRMEVSEVTFPMHVSKGGKDFCIADYDYYLRHATQEQIDMSESVYGDRTYMTRRGKMCALNVDWSKCWVLWKDDFIRIGNPEKMDMEQMLFRYLGIWATGFRDKGVGSIDGYLIASYEDFKQYATDEQIRAVDLEIEKKKLHGYLPPLPWKIVSSVTE